MRIALRCLFIIVFLLWGFLDLIDLPEQITQVLGLPDQISPYLTDRMLSVAVLVVGLALFGWSVFGEQVLKKLGVRGSIKVRFPAYRPLEDDPPLTVFAPASRWGENKICRIWRLEISNNGSQSIADLNVLISGRGRQRRLPIDCQRLGLLGCNEPSINLHPGESVTVEVAFALDAKVAHNEFDGMAESEMGLCLLDVKPPCNLLRKAPWEAVIEVRGAGLRPVRRNVVLYPNEQNDLVLETEPPFKWPWRGSDTVKIKPHVPVPTR